MTMEYGDPDPLYNLIDRALDERAAEWYEYNDLTDSTTVYQDRLVRIIMQVVRDYYEA